MPSEDAKTLRKAEPKQEEEDDDDESLHSMAKKKLTANAGGQNPKSRLKSVRVKKEEFEVQDNSDNFGGASKGKGNSGPRAMAAKLKKEEPQDDSDYEKPIKGKVKKEENGGSDCKPISNKNSSTKADKELNKKKRKGEEMNGSTPTQPNGRKREKKVYDFPGQKRDTPEERDPLRIFYETLYEQVPSSEMAQIWMMESGLLSLEEARKVYDKKQRKNQQITVTKTTKSTTIMKKTTTSAVSVTKKKTTQSKVVVRPGKKRKMADGSSEDESDFETQSRGTAKKRRTS